MIEWITENKEWLFSGVGIVILGFVYKILANKKKQPESQAGTQTNVTTRDSKGMVIAHEIREFKQYFGADTKQKVLDQHLRYLRELAKETMHLPWANLDPDYADPKRGESLVLTDIYTPLDTNEPERMESEENVREFLIRQHDVKRISAQEMINIHPRLALLGDPGSGKSTFVNFMTYIMAQAGQSEKPDEWMDHLKQIGNWQHGVLTPIRVALRDFSQYCKSEPENAGSQQVASYLKSVMEQDDFKDYWEIMRDGFSNPKVRYLILFDGLDEVPQAFRKNITEMINGFAKKYSQHRFIVTCRLYAYIRKEYQLEGFHQAVLAPFNRSQIEKFISAWYRKLAAKGRFTKKEAEEHDERLNRASARPDLKGLAERPLLLTVMALLHTYRGQLPEDRIELYKSTVDLLLRRWESRIRGEEGLMEKLDIPGLRMDHLKAGLYEAAFFAHKGQGAAEGTADISEEMLYKQLAPYLNSWDKAGVFIDYVRERAGLLIRHKSEAYTFPHRTFQEYMAACHLVNNMKDYPSESAQLVIKDPVQWRMVFILAAGYAARESRPGQAVASVNALCPASIDECSPDAALFHRAEIAAEALLEISLLDVNRDDTGKAVLNRVKKWLLCALDTDLLEPKDRVESGELISRLGDPRDLKKFIPVKGGEYALSLGKMNVAPFCMSKYPVTNQWYAEFVNDNGYSRKEFWTEEGLKWLDETKASAQRFWNDYPWNNANAPVVGVSWYEALAFCRRLTITQNDGAYRLPTESEWEAAAAGFEGREYAWIGEFDKSKCNSEESGIGKTSAVGIFKTGETPEGISDLNGNVWEWTCSDYHTKNVLKDFPLDKELMKLIYEMSSGEKEEELRKEYISMLNDKERRFPVVRGGSWYYDAGSCRSADRAGLAPSDRLRLIGFRVLLLPRSTV